MVRGWRKRGLFLPATGALKPDVALLVSRPGSWLDARGGCWELAGVYGQLPATPQRV